MTKLELAAEAAFQLQSDADLVTRMASAAKVHLRGDNPDPIKAREWLSNCKEHAERVEFRYNDLLRLISECEGDGEEEGELVCDACFSASCAAGELMCEDSQTAGFTRRKKGR